MTVPIRSSFKGSPPGEPKFGPLLNPELMICFPQRFSKLTPSFLNLSFFHESFLIVIVASSDQTPPKGCDKLQDDDNYIID